MPLAIALNISTRLDVHTGEDVLIGGFIITGSSPKRVLVRGIGPSLPVQGALADPTLELHKPDGGIVTNDNWKIDDNTQQSQQSTIEATGAAPTSDFESALVATLPPGNYTAVVAGKNGGAGIGLVEVFDLSQTGSQLANISTRGFVESGDNVMIGGFILGPENSTGATQVVVRGIGPSLSSAGVLNALDDPALELHDANGSVISNDNWQDDSQQAVQLQSLHIAPIDPRESAMVQTLTLGAYTAIVRGVNNATGVALVEVYNVQ